MATNGFTRRRSPQLMVGHVHSDPRRPGSASCSRWQAGHRTTSPVTRLVAVTTIGPSGTPSKSTRTIAPPESPVTPQEPWWLVATHCTCPVSGSTASSVAFDACHSRAVPSSLTDTTSDPSGRRRIGRQRANERRGFRGTACACGTRRSLRCGGRARRPGGARRLALPLESVAELLPGEAGPQPEVVELLAGRPVEGFEDCSLMHRGSRGARQVLRGGTVNGFTRRGLRQSSRGQGRTVPSHPSSRSEYRLQNGQRTW